MSKSPSLDSPFRANKCLMARRYNLSNSRPVTEGMNELDSDRAATFYIGSTCVFHRLHCLQELKEKGNFKKLKLITVLGTSLILGKKQMRSQNKEDKVNQDKTGQTAPKKLIINRSPC